MKLTYFTNYIYYTDSEANLRVIISYAFLIISISRYTLLENTIRKIKCSSTLDKVSIVDDSKRNSIGRVISRVLLHSWWRTRGKNCPNNRTVTLWHNMSILTIQWLTELTYLNTKNFHAGIYYIRFVQHFSLSRRLIVRQLYW